SAGERSCPWSHSLCSAERAVEIRPPVLEMRVDVARLRQPLGVEVRDDERLAASGACQVRSIRRDHAAEAAIAEFAFGAAAVGVGEEYLVLIGARGHDGARDD